jgi:hypothetical protein
MAIWADYLRGHPDFQEPIKGGILEYDGQGGLRFTEKSTVSVMNLPGLSKPEDIVMSLPEAELVAVSLGSFEKRAGAFVGGLVPVAGVSVGLGGAVGGSDSVAVTCAIELAGQRHLVIFWSGTEAAQAQVDGLQRERVGTGRLPLPRIEDLDSARDASKRAGTTEVLLTEIRDLLSQQNILLAELRDARRET